MVLGCFRLHAVFFFKKKKKSQKPTKAQCMCLQFRLLGSLERKHLHWRVHYWSVSTIRPYTDGVGYRCSIGTSEVLGSIPRNAKKTKCVSEWVSEYTYINKEEGEKKFKESLKKKKQSKKLEVYYIAKKKQNSPPQMIVFSYNIRNQLILKKKLKSWRW